MAKHEYIEGKTSSGFEYKIDKRRLDNYELLEAISELETNSFKIIDIVELLLGENKDKLRDHLRDEDGFVSMQKMNDEITEIFSSNKEVKN